MKYLPLGQTDMRASVIALGCWPFAGDFNWGAQDDAESIATVRAALDCGVNLFDTAEAYGAGRSEEVLGKALVGRRQEALIATKVSPDHLSTQGIEEACERSLRFLGTDYIDLYQVHWPSHTIPLEESLRALENLRTKGKARAIGVCNYGVLDMKDLNAAGRVETNQLPYSLLWRAIEYGIQPRCLDYGLGIICYQPLMQGLLAGKFASADDVPAGRARTRHFSGARQGTRHGEAGHEAETFGAIERIRAISAQVGASMADVSLAWVLSRPAVASVLCGARRPQQIIENARSADITLAPEVIAQLDAATAPLKQALGSNPDPYQGGANTRFR